MIEIYSAWDNLIHVKNTDNKKIEIDYSKKEIKIDSYLIDFPGEYEKSWILLEVKEYEWIFFYSFLVEWKVVFLIIDDNFELKEDILKFFWDIDILLIVWTRNSNKIIENIEARIIIPFGEWREICLNSLWQHKEEIDVFKVKSSDINNDETQIINIKI
jgi:hypothetical protein